MIKMDLKQITLQASIALAIGFPTLLQAHASSEEAQKLMMLNAPHAKAVTVQIGSFHSRENAYRLKARWETLVNYPVNVRHEGHYYHVTVGPVPPTNIARFEYSPKPRPLPTRPEVKPVSAPVAYQPVTKLQTGTKTGAPSWYSDYIPRIRIGGAWYLAVDGGMMRPSVNSTILVNNGSGFDAPHDLDRYSTTASNPALIALSAGRYWERESTWLPGYYLGLRYQHLFSHDVDGAIMQYSLPAFTNYRDSWSISSNMLLAYTKLELTKAGPVRPYVNGGLGVSVNQFGTYTEYGEPSITIRTSPAFASRSKTAFAYNLGCGLNFNMNANIVFSVGYDYQNIGSSSSGPGRTTWSGERLNQGGINGNSIILGATFLFDKKY